MDGTRLVAAGVMLAVLEAGHVVPAYAGAQGMDRAVDPLANRPLERDASRLRLIRTQHHAPMRCQPGRELHRHATWCHIVAFGPVERRSIVRAAGATTQAGMHPARPRQIRDQAI